MLALSTRRISTVLLVDEYEVRLPTWERELRTLGKTVLKAACAETAEQLAASGHPDLALVELFLPGTSGIDAVRRLRRLDDDMLIVLLSANMSVAYAVEGIRAGATDVTFKAASVRGLLRCLETGVSANNHAFGETLNQMEWEHITRVMLECKNNVTLAAKRLGIYRQTLQRKLRKRLQGM